MPKQRFRMSILGLFEREEVFLKTGNIFVKL